MGYAWRPKRQDYNYFYYTICFVVLRCDLAGYIQAGGGALQKGNALVKTSVFHSLPGDRHLAGHDIHATHSA